MALLFFKYRTDQGNTVIASSPNSFTLGPNEAQLQTNYDIPAIQPLYLYFVTGSTLAPNADNTINSYLNFIGSAPQNVTQVSFNSYTGTTAPATFQSKSSIYTYTGTTVPATYLTKSAFNAYSATTSGGVSYALFSLYTGTTAPATYALKSNFNTFTGTTAPATYLKISNFNPYSASTLSNINSRLLTTLFTTYTGTTAPATYLKISNFNTYSASTLTSINSKLNTSLFSTYTGTTAPASFASKNNFNTFTGTTAPATYLKISAFNTYSGLTLTNINTRLLTSAFNTYSGATLTNINSRLLTTAFNTYSGATATSIASKLATSAFNTYSAATATQIQLAQYGLDFKQSVFVATTANITLSGLQTIDGVSVTAGKRVLVKNQTSGATNGIYVAAAGAWARSADANGTTAGPVTSGLYTFVETGTTNQDSAWALTTQDPITVGTTSLTFTKVTTLSDLTPGNGINKVSNTISVKPSDIAGSGLLASATQLSVNVTGGTVFTTFTPRTIFNTFTGTTAPATYLTKSAFNTYSGVTLTNINSRLLTSAFNTYTGTTAPATYALKSNFNTFTGTTAPATYALKTNFNTFTGTTAPATYVAKTLFNTFTGSTINTANNGLTKSGTNVRLGGALTGATTIDATTFGLTLTGSTGQLSIGRTTGGIRVSSRNNVNIAGLSAAGVERTKLYISATGATFTDSRTGTTAKGLEYAADYSTTYSARSHMDYGTFTGNTLYTKAQILVYASGTTDLNVTSAVNIPLNRLIRNNSTYFSYTGGTKIKILVAGTYDVSYLINATNNNATAHSAAANIIKNGTTVAETTTTCSTVGTSAAGASMALPPTQLTFAANDVISLAGFRLITGGGNFFTTANSVFLSIVKKY